RERPNTDVDAHVIPKRVPARPPGSAGTRASSGSDLTRGAVQPRVAGAAATVRTMLIHAFMAHREFNDERGLPWEVWDVVPERRDRRSGVERRKHARETFDRRKMRVLSAVITGD